MCAKSCCPDLWTSLGAGTAVAEGLVRDSGIDLTRARATWRGLAASLDGRIASGRSLAVRGTLNVDLQEISRAMGFGPLSGRAGLSAELTGRGQTPVIEGRAEIPDLVAGGRAVEPIEASFRMAASPGPDSRWEGTVRSSRVRWDQLAVENITASLAVDGRQIALVGARARAAGVPIEASGVWEWAGSGRGHAALGPVALGAITGVPPSLRLSGTGRATVDASAAHGVVSARALAKLDQLSAAGVSLGAGRPRSVCGVRRSRARCRSRRGGCARRQPADSSPAGVLASSFELDDLALAPLLREVGSAAAEHVEGRVSSRGELSDPTSANRRAGAASSVSRPTACGSSASPGRARGRSCCAGRGRDSPWSVSGWTVRPEA